MYELTDATKEMNLPQMCCTCDGWRPLKDNIERGQCAIIGTGFTNYDHICSLWVNCESNNKKS